MPHDALVAGRDVKFFSIIFLFAIAVGCAVSPARTQEGELPRCEAPISNAGVNWVSRLFKWETRTSPVHIAGPIYFVGTEGLGAYLIKTSDGHILLNTGMRSSGPMIEWSISQIKHLAPKGKHEEVKTKNIKWLLANHAHVDHVGGHAYFKESDKFAIEEVRVRKPDTLLLADGGKTDFQYRNCKGFAFPAVAGVKDFDEDRQQSGTYLPFTRGDVSLQIIPTPGHTRGSTTFMAEVEHHGKKYKVVFLDGANVNLGYKVNPLKEQSYTDIDEDFRATFKRLISLEPDIWLSAHTADFDFDDKRKLAATKQSPEPWLDRGGPDGYKCFVARRWVEFERRARAPVTEAAQHLSKHCTSP